MMEEFKTVRECYETCKYGDTLEKESIGAVSYTHLTLPTILLV